MRLPETGIGMPLGEKREESKNRYGKGNYDCKKNTDKHNINIARLDFLLRTVAEEVSEDGSGRDSPHTKRKREDSSYRHDRAPR
ncbi:MAG TPA: hypothetical protein VJB56_01685 [Candidatus Paceibacterota bacterium]